MACTSTTESVALHYPKNLQIRPREATYTGVRLSKEQQGSREARLCPLEILNVFKILLMKQYLSDLRDWELLRGKGGVSLALSISNE